MTRAEFETATFFEFNCRLKGWQEIQDRNERIQVENARMLASAVWMTAPWKGNRIPDAKKVFPMPWDPRPKAVQKTEYEIAVGVYKVRKAHGKNLKVNSDREAAFQKYREQLIQEFGELK